VCRFRWGLLVGDSRSTMTPFWSFRLLRGLSEGDRFLSLVLGYFCSFLLDRGGLFLFGVFVFFVLLGF